MIFMYKTLVDVNSSFTSKRQKIDTLRPVQWFGEPRRTPMERPNSTPNPTKTLCIVSWTSYQKNFITNNKCEG